MSTSNWVSDPDACRPRFASSMRAELIVVSRGSEVDDRVGSYEIRVVGVVAITLPSLPSRNSPETF